MSVIAVTRPDAAPALRLDFILSRICESLGLRDDDVVGPPRFADKHHLMRDARPFRFDGEITLDGRGGSDLSDQEQRLVLELTAPLAERFGYV